LAFGELKLDLPTTDKFEAEELAWLVRKKLSSDLRYICWVAADSLYLGQAKVDKCCSKRMG